MKNFFALFVLVFFLALPASRAQGFFAPAGGGEPVTNVKVYPNPSTTGDFTTEFYWTSTTEIVKVKVYNLVGREVYREEVNPTSGYYKSTLSLRNLSKGVYMLEISKGDKRITRRLSYI